MFWHRIIYSLCVFALTLALAAPAAPLVHAQSGPAEGENARLGLLLSTEYHPDIQLAEQTAGQRPARQPAVQPAAPRLAWARIAFQSYRDGNFEIYTALDDGSDLRRLTNHAASDLEPRLNRGGTMVAFASNRTGNYEVYSMKSDGSGLAQLTNTPASDGRPVWSPDGRKIAFQSYRDGHAEVYVMNADGSGQTRLTNVASGFNGEPAWSPDGKKIAFTAYRNNQWRIWVMNADGSGQTQLSNTAYSENPVWSPDGKKIAFDSDTDASGFQDVVIMNSDGASFGDGSKFYTVITAPYMQDYLVYSWSPDGNFVAYTQVTYVYYNDTWYWDTAYLKCVDANRFMPSPEALFGTDLDWDPDWQSLDSVTPQATLSPLETYSPMPLVLSWTVKESGSSGLKGVNVQWKEGLNGAWTNWQTLTASSSAAFSGTAGHTYSFRIQAIDNALNTQPWNEWNPSGDAITTLYHSGVVGAVMDNSGAPVSDAAITTNPAPFQGGASDLKGAYGVYVAEASGPVPVNWSKAGYGSPPETLDVPGKTMQIDVALPPSDNIVANTDLTFAGQAEAPWVAGGSLPQGSTTTYHTGAGAYQMGLPAGTASIETPRANETAGTSGMRIVVDPSGIVHAVWHESAYQTFYGFYYAWRGLNGVWSTPEQLFSSFDTFSGYYELIRTPNGDLHLAYLVDKTIYYRLKPAGAGWDAPQIVSTHEDLNSFFIVPGINGDVHMTWMVPGQTTAITYYTHRHTGGSWSQVASMTNDTLSVDDHVYEMVVDSAGTLHVLWNHYYQGNLRYSRMLSNHTWTAREPIDTAALHDTQDMVVAQDGTVYVVYDKWSDYTDAPFFSSRNPNSGTWSTPIRLYHSPFQYARDLHLEVNAGGELDFIWYGNGIYGAPCAVLRLTRSPNGDWSPPIKLMGDTSAAYLSVNHDSYGNLHVTWQNNALVYYAKRLNGIWQPALEIANSNDIAWWGRYSQIFVDDNGKYHIVYSYNKEYTTYDPYFGAYYLTQHITAADGEATLDLPLTLPQAMAHPSLSFFYDATTLTPANGGRFDVQVIDSQGTSTLLTTSADTPAWTHQWLDLTAWAGQAITLRWQLALTGGELPGEVLLDDVTVGSANPDLWVNSDPFSGWTPDTDQQITFTYGNQGGAPAAGSVSAELPQGITFVSASPAPSQVNGQVITWTTDELAAKQGPLTIQLTVHTAISLGGPAILTGSLNITTAAGELETANNSAPLTIHIGRDLFLPLLARH